jgi:hypothetical protein
MARLTFSPLFRRAMPHHGFLGFAAAAVLLAGCASLPDFSALEDDEMYLGRGEEFVTDSKYLAFALEQAGAQDVMEDDYYDADRSGYGQGYVGGYGMPGYQPSYNNPYRPFSNGLGLQSYFNPMNGSGMGMGMGYGMGYGGLNGMNNGFGYNSMGYNPYGFNGWNNGYNPYGYYNPFGNNGWNNGYSGWGNNGNAGPYFGSINGEGSGLTSFTRTPIMSYTNNGSNYDDAGVLVRPKSERDESSNSVQPTVVTPERGTRKNRWMQASQKTETRSTRNTNNDSGNSNWNSRSRSSGSSGANGSNNSFSVPTSTPRSNSTRSNSTRSSGSSPRGSSNGNSRSSRGGGK